MTQPNSVTLAEIRSVLEPFDLGEIQAVSPVAGSFRAHWLSTGRGRYVLSIFGPDVTSKHLAAMQAVRRQLAAAGLPVVPPMRQSGAIPARGVRIHWTVTGGLLQSRLCHWGVAILCPQRS